MLLVSGLAAVQPLGERRMEQRLLLLLGEIPFGLVKTLMGWCSDYWLETERICKSLFSQGKKKRHVVELF